MNQPKILLADEPIGNLDAENACRVLELLRRERERGLNLLVVAHDDFLLQGVDQVLRLENGVLSWRTPCATWRSVIRANL